MNFTVESKVKDVALSNPAARRVLEQAGVDYCCGGATPLGDACLSAGTSAGAILDRLREAGERVESDKTGWNSAPLSELTAHIRNRHHQYVRQAISTLSPLLAKVRTKHDANHPEVAEIERMFLEIGNEMRMHMQKEEQVLFPYIEAMERSAQEHSALEPPFFQTVRNPVRAMMNEHDAAGELTRRIREASSSYTPPADACTSYQALYQGLQEFEQDLHEHVHLENNILFPRAIELERSLSA